MSSLNCTAADEGAGKPSGQGGLLDWLERHHLPFYFLTFYILFAFYSIDLYMASEYTAVMGLLPLLFLNWLGVGALGSLYRTKMEDPGYLDHDWARPFSLPCLQKSLILYSINPCKSDLIL